MRSSTCWKALLGESETGPGSRYGRVLGESNLSRYSSVIEGPRGGLGPAHTALLQYVADGSDVLDIGCSSGYLAAQLEQHGCSVVGIELDPVDAAAARAHCNLVIEGDVEHLDLSMHMQGRTFDAIILGDVLEHLRAPERVLQRVQSVLRRGGRIVVSIPNVAHLSIRLQLLLGGFWYSRVGLLDETHIRFFTFESFSALARESGLAVLSMTRIEEPANPDLWAEVTERLRLSTEGVATLREFLRQPSASTFQYVLQLAPYSPDMLVSSHDERPSWALPLTEFVADRDEQVRSLQEQVAEQTAWALSAVEQIHARDHTIRELQRQHSQQLRERDETIRLLRRGG